VEKARSDIFVEKNNFEKMQFFLISLMYRLSPTWTGTIVFRYAMLKGYAKTSTVGYSQYLLAA
jgi:hypothetical protein